MALTCRCPYSLLSESSVTANETRTVQGFPEELRGRERGFCQRKSLGVYCRICRAVCQTSNPDECTLAVSCGHCYRRGVNVSHVLVCVSLFSFCFHFVRSVGLPWQLALPSPCLDPVSHPALLSCIC